MNDLIPAGDSHSLVERKDFEQRLSAYRRSHPFLPEHIGRRNPYTHKEIKTASDYDDYVREYVFHSACEDACRRSIRRRTFFSFVRLLVISIAAVLFVYNQILPNARIISYDDGYSAGYSSGYSEGTTSGYKSGYSIGLEDGSAPVSPGRYASGGNVGFSYLAPSENDEETVYVTDTGTKYHRRTCSYLHSSHAMELKDAKDRGYSPCSRCKPPT